MSVPVPLDRLRAEIERVGTTPYLLTVSDGERPHCTAIAVSWRDDELVMAPGNRTLANASARPAVTLLWPPCELNGYSLIVDADVTEIDGQGTGDHTLAARPTHAVLHRPAAPGAPLADGCGSDCVLVYPD